MAFAGEPIIGTWQGRHTAKEMKMVKAAQTPATAAKSFFETLATFAAPIAKLSNAQAQQDPVLAQRTRFANAVMEQIKLLKSAADSSRWFKKVNGKYQLTVRNGNTALKLGENTFFEADDAAKAVSFLEAVIAGAKAGELDKVLADSARKPRAKKEKAAAAPTPAVQPEVAKA